MIRLIGIVLLILDALSVAIIIRALLSWFPFNPNNPVVQLVNAITDPIIQPIRRIMPRVGVFDLSPLLAIILLQALKWLVVRAI